MLTLAATVFPIYRATEYTEAATLASSNSSLIFTSYGTGRGAGDESVSGGTSVFSEVEAARFSITTNNYTGYTLTIRSKARGNRATQLTNGTDVLNSISSAVAVEEFAKGDNTEYDNLWGYMPSKYNSLDNASLLPAPTGTDILDVTTGANPQANTYNISMGARIGYIKSGGVYSNDTFVIEYVANPVNYSVTYNENTGDGEAEDMPSPLTQADAVSSTGILLSEAVPTRTGYTFGGWCDEAPSAINGIQICGGTVYAPGAVFGLDDTTPNISNLYAMWQLNSYNVTIRTSEGVNSVELKGVVCESTDGCEVKNLAYGASYPLSATLAEGYAVTGWENAAGLGVVSEDGTTYTVGAGETVLTPVAEPTAYDVMVHLDGAESATFYNEKYGEQVVTEDGAVVSLMHGVTYEISMGTTEEKEFLAWAVEGKGELVSENTERALYKVTGETTIVARGKEKVTCNAEAMVIAEAVCLQDLTAENMETVKESMEEGTEYSLVDVRDGKSYAVAKLADGKIWMMQDLDFDVILGRELTSETTDLNYSGEDSIYNAENGYGVENEVIAWRPVAGTVNYLSTAKEAWGEGVKAVSQMNGTELGNYYDFTMTVAVNKMLERNAEDEQKDVAAEVVTMNVENSICPKGWRLPTAGGELEASEFAVLNSLYSEDSKLAGALKYTANGVLGEMVLDSAADKAETGRGGYWSSTMVDDSSYGLTFDSETVNFASQVEQTRGMRVRCVARD